MAVMVAMAAMVAMMAMAAMLAMLLPSPAPAGSSTLGNVQQETRSFLSRGYNPLVRVKMEYPCTHFINGSLVHSREEKVNQNLVGGVAAGGLGCLKAYLTLSQRPPIATVGNLVLAPALSLCRPPRTERDAARGAPPRGAPGGNGRRSTAMTRRSSWIRCALCRYLGGLPFDTTLLDG